MSSTANLDPAYRVRDTLAQSPTTAATLEVVRAFLDHPSLRARAAIWDYFEAADSIPGLPREEALRFGIVFLLDAISVDRPDELVPQVYEAAIRLAAFIVEFDRTVSGSATDFEYLSERLAALVTYRPERCRDVVRNGLLEHVPREPRTRVFADWTTPDLRELLESA